MIMATALRILRGGATAEPLETRVAFVKSIGGKRPDPDIIAKFEGLGPAEFRKAMLLLDVLVTNVKPRVEEVKRRLRQNAEEKLKHAEEAKRMEQCKDHEWVMKELLRNDITNEEKLKIIAYAIHFDQQAMVVITSNEAPVMIGDNDSIGGGNYLVKGTFNEKDVMVQILTKEQVDDARMIFIVGNLLVQAGGRNIQMIQASGYDEDSGMITKQSMDETIRSCAAENSGSVIYGIRIKFDIDDPMARETVIKNIAKILGKVVKKDIPIAQYDFQEILAMVFNDCKRMRALLTRITKVLENAKNIDGKALVPKNTIAEAVSIRLDKSDNITVEKTARQESET